MIEGPPKVSHYALLDAFRGYLAIWVVCGHCAHYVGAPGLVPVPAIAVDLFMLLSGLLMTVIYRVREKKESFLKRRSFLTFYVRRYFRIAPVYYLLFATALIAAPKLNELNQEVVLLEAGDPIPEEGVMVETGSWEGTWSSGMIPYAEPDAINILTHLTFVFGLIPAVSSNNWTPDWSIGLEMQFYLVFPFLMLFVRKLGYLALAILILPLAWYGKDWFGNYGEPGSLLHFAQPSFLPIKIAIFLVGMLLGEALASAKTSMKETAPWLLGAILLMHVYQLDWIMKGVSFLSIWILCMAQGNPAPVRWVSQFLNRISSLAVFKFLADVSYFTYLAHLMLIVPVRRVLATSSSYLELDAVVRFGILSTTVCLICWILGWVAFRLVESPGIRLGQRIVGKINERPA